MIRLSFAMVADGSKFETEMLYYEGFAFSSSLCSFAKGVHHLL